MGWYLQGFDGGARGADRDAGILDRHFLCISLSPVSDIYPYTLDLPYNCTYAIQATESLYVTRPRSLPKHAPPLVQPRLPPSPRQHRHALLAYRRAVTFSSIADYVSRGGDGFVIPIGPG